MGMSGKTLAVILSSALLLSDCVLAVLVLLNLRAESRYSSFKFLQHQLQLQRKLANQAALPQQISDSKSKSISKSKSVSPSVSMSTRASSKLSPGSERIPALKYFINRLSCLGIGLHMVWAVDPAGWLGIYTRQVVITLAVLQLAISLVGLSTWFTSWIWILLKDWDFDDGQARKLSIGIWMFMCALPLSGLLAAAVCAAIQSKIGIFYGCLSFLYLLAVTSTAMVILSSYVAFKVYGKLNFRKENKMKQMYILRRQVLLVLAQNTVLALIVIVLDANIVKMAVYTPLTIPSELLAVGSGICGIVWYIAPYLAYVPRVQKEQMESRCPKTPTPRCSV